MKKRIQKIRNYIQFHPFMTAWSILALIMTVTLSCTIFKTPGEDQIDLYKSISEQVYMAGDDLVEVPNGITTNRTPSEISVKSTYKFGYTGGVKAFISDGELTFDVDDGLVESILNSISLGIALPGLLVLVIYSFRKN